MDRSKWEYKKLGEVCTVVSGSTPKTQIEDFWNGNHFWITPAELDGSTYVSKSDRLLTDLAIEKTNLTLMPAGTVLLSSRAPIGKVAITTVPMYCNQGFKNLICSPAVHNKYLYWFLKGKTDYLNSLGRGATFKEISKTIVENIKIPVYSIETQQNIADEIDCLNEMIAVKQEQLKEFDKLAQSIFYDMFGDVSLTFHELNSLYEFIDYRGKTPNKISTGIPLITARNIRFGYLDYSVPEFISFEEFETRKTRGVAQKGDILFTTEAPMGFVAIADKDVFSTGQRVITLQRKDKVQIHNVYMLYYLMSEEFQRILLNNATGVTVKGIKAAKLKKIKVGVPPLSLQQQFAEKISAIEAQKELVKQSIAETQQLFNSKMDYYFND